MKIFESKLAHLRGYIFWCFCLYALIAIVFEIFFYYFQTTMTRSTFIIIGFMWLGQTWRLKKMRYKINEDALIQYDFQHRTLFIEEIVSVHILKGMKWISFHSPYNIVIETINKEKFFMAPEHVEEMVQLLKDENPDIQIIRD